MGVSDGNADIERSIAGGVWCTHPDLEKSTEAVHRFVGRLDASLDSSLGTMFVTNATNFYV
jgi:hypothetical protein